MFQPSYVSYDICTETVALIINMIWFYTATTCIQKQHIYVCMMLCMCQIWTRVRSMRIAHCIYIYVTNNTRVCIECMIVGTRRIQRKSDICSWRHVFRWRNIFCSCADSRLLKCTTNYWKVICIADKPECSIAFNPYT